MKISWRRYTKYLGGLICFFAGIHIGNAYVTGYWRFDPFNLGWDTVGRGIILLIIGTTLHTLVRAKALKSTLIKQQ
jgi:hypothetical protein